MNGLIYAAVVIGICSGIVGVLVGIAVLHRIIAPPSDRRPVLIWLLVCLVAMSGATVIEQTRVLVFRLSFDGYAEAAWFREVYGSTWNVVSSKVMAAVAMTTAAAIKVAIWQRLSDRMVVCWAARAAGGTMAAWLAIAALLEWWIG